MEIQKFSSEQLVEAAKQLKKGKLIAFPTETVYGLGANALLPDSVREVFSVKGRPSDNPLIVHVTGLNQVKEYAEICHPLTETIVNQFWPGPLTIILPVKSGKLDKIVTGGLPTAAFRMPNNPITLDVIQKAGVPLVGPSANLSGKPSPTTAEHVIHDFKSSIYGVIDGGPATIGVESTVIDLSLSDQPPMILRPGAITKEMLEEVCGVEILVDKHLVSDHTAPKSPGMKYKHYSPATKTVMVQENDWEKVVETIEKKHLRAGILSGPTVSQQTRTVAAALFTYANDSVEAATKGLFSGLRALDESTAHLEIIFVATFPEEGLGVAYMNRLKKAAGQTYFTNNSR